MKAEFKEEKKESGHVGLYKANNSDMVVLFPDDCVNTGIVIVSNGRLKVGSVYKDFLSCLTSDWIKINSNSVTFTW